MVLYQNCLLSTWHATYFQNKVEPDDKCTLPLILLYTRKAKSFTFETIIATSFTFLFLEPDASFLLK